MKDEELNDNHYIEFESYDLVIITPPNKKTLFEVTIDRNSELFWCNKECLSFHDAIKIQDQIDNMDESDTGFKPWYIPAFNLFPSKEEFTCMMEYFDINKSKIASYENISRI